ncbi:MAG: hypothetical protein ACI8ZB_002533 [Desulforhopalus sp.]|jgi:hypothetical protein
MTTESTNKNSKLVQSLREAVSLVQMILFKEIRTHFNTTLQHTDQAENAMLAGAITNEVFGTQNPEARFKTFKEDNWGIIEQELLSLHENHTFLCQHITDALRIQTLCDSQEGEDSAVTLIEAKKYGYLLEEREIPLPSTFMTIIREIGKEHGLVVPPLQISPEEDNSLLH